MERRQPPRHAASRRGGQTSMTLGIILLVLSAMTGTIPFILMIIQSNHSQALAAQHAAAVENIDRQTIDGELQDAYDYNRRLSDGGQNVIGEAADPWSGSGEPLSSTDSAYRGRLVIPPDGIMATVRYPRLGINLPVRHGTGSDSLDRGAGHLYGTSLPVGGENTHAVISAHSGLADQLMFDKLNGFGMKAEQGDVFYLDVLGETLAYKVVSINVVDPDDFTKLKIESGRDLVTLLTCTPYGVNDHRLLVTGERTSMPQEKAEQTSTDRTNIYFMLYIIGFWTIAILGAIVGRSRGGRKRKRHVRKKHAKR